ncbi:MAG: hypothetical protein HXS52_00380 [Theionarchaea archaeon]|nr:hypothetical protein [Theionarchaea archaeon]
MLESFVAGDEGFIIAINVTRMKPTEKCVDAKPGFHEVSVIRNVINAFFCVGCAYRAFIGVIICEMGYFLFANKRFSSTTIPELDSHSSCSLVDGFFCGDIHVRYSVQAVELLK